jgi:hypothetical protein
MSGGARRDRTADLLLAKQALSRLSYGPEPLAAILAAPTLATRILPKDRQALGRTTGLGGSGWS